MEWWAIFLMIIVLVTAVICITYFILKIYFPYQFATFNYHINTRGHYASNDPPTLATFRSKSEGDIIFTETGCYAKQNLASSKANMFASKDDLPASSDSRIMLDGEATSPLGQIQVGLDLDYDTSELVVLIIEARDLDPTHCRVVNDHYEYYICVDVMHTEDAMSSAKTKAHEHNDTGPIMFKERFLFKVNVPDLTRKVVRFRVVAISKTSNRHHEVGKAVITISDIDITRARRLWLNLKDMNLEDDCRGELMLSLTYLPTASRITLVIIKAKTLRWKILRQKTGDIMVSVSLVCNGKRVSKRQTSVKRKVRDPIFNESLIFSVTNPNDNMHLRVTVSEVLTSGRLYTIGHCILGPTGSGSELTHWQQMISNPRRPSAMWHWLHKSSKRLKAAANTKKNVKDYISNQTSEDSEGGPETSDPVGNDEANLNNEETTNNNNYNNNEIKDNKKVKNNLIDF